MNRIASTPPVPQTEFDVDRALDRVAHWLPTQGPIKDFVHHNTLHAFEGLPFHEGIAAGARLHGARTSMPAPFFLEAHRAGRISESAIERALRDSPVDGLQRDAARAALFSSTLDAPAFPGWARGGLRAGWTERLGGVALHRRSHLHLLRLLGGYLDQGLSTWRMPGAETDGFYECVARLARSGPWPLLPFNTPSAQRLLALPARDALLAALAKTVGREDYYEAYLLETLLTLPGWAGVAGVCERNPGLLLNPRRVALLDCASVALIAELGCLERELGRAFRPLCEAASPPGVAPLPDARPRRTEAEQLLSVWQEALEWSYYEPLLGALSANATRAKRKRPPARFWAFFCIDDRSCSIRRHLEEVDPAVATFGTAGFFGLDFFYKGAEDAIAGKHCPAPMTPTHLVVEELGRREERSARRGVPWWDRTLHLETQSNTFFRGWFLSYALGVGSAVRLAADVLRPSLAPVAVPPLSTMSSGAQFRFLREGDAESDGLALGYSAEELADRVAEVLRSTGADDHWPEIVFLFGHGASSVNNPYFAAYNCGACSGRVGAPNARVFAKAANHPVVRRALESRGIRIPPSTWFVGALYDTTRDQATYYDLEDIPAQFRQGLLEFQRECHEALARNAVERCRRFDSVPLPVSPDRALEEVRLRSVSLFQPRPEYNHATNASCVVGRRSLTEGLFLDRRAFMSSYDPSRDPDGDILAGILSAVIPVCAGINLEYFFSRVDPQVYGAGTKLPHNVNGLVGVCNGIEGDLLTGLPIQMTEIHDPLRLIVVVEQSPDVALRAAQRHTANARLVANEWIRYACLDPVTHEAWIYRRGAMEKVTGLRPPTWAWPSSSEAAQQGRGDLPIGFLGELELARAVGS